MGSHSRLSSGRPPGDHFGAIVGPFWSTFGAIWERSLNIIVTIWGTSLKLLLLFFGVAVLAVLLALPVLALAALALCRLLVVFVCCSCFSVWLFVARSGLGALALSLLASLFHLAPLCELAAPLSCSSLLLFLLCVARSRSFWPWFSISVSLDFSVFWPWHRARETREAIPPQTAERGRGARPRSCRRVFS